MNRVAEKEGSKKSQRGEERHYNLLPVSPKSNTQIPIAHTPGLALAMHDQTHFSMQYPTFVTLQFAQHIHLLVLQFQSIQRLFNDLAVGADHVGDEAKNAKLEAHNNEHDR